MDTILANCKGYYFTEDFCKHIREFKRHSLDVYNELIFILPNGEQLLFVTSRMDGQSFEYRIPSFRSKAPSEFQKTRWWKIM